MTTPHPPKRRGLLRKIIKGSALLISGILLLLILFFLTAPLWQKQWIDARTHVDLSPQLPPMTKTEVKPGDAYDLCLQATKLLIREDQLFPDQHKQLNQEWRNIYKLPFTKDTFPLYSALLTANEPAFKLLRAIPAAPNQRVPSADTDNLKNPSPLNDRLYLSKLLAANARAKAANGEWQSAFDELNVNLSMSLMFSNGGILINSLLGITTGGMSLAQLQRLPIEHRIPPSILKQETKWLEQYEQKLPPFTETLKEEFRFQHDTFDKQWNSGVIFTMFTIDQDFFTYHTDPKQMFWHNLRLRLKLLFRPVKHTLYRHGAWLLGSSKKNVLASLNACNAKLISRYSQPYDQSIRTWTVDLPEKNARNLFLYRDPVGLAAVQALEDIYKYQYFTALDHLWQLRLTRTALAINAYQQEKGQAPPTLDVLVPEYLSTVPLDPFNDPHPLRYKLEPDGNWLLYSIGPDQTDDGGTSAKQKRARPDTKGDLVFSPRDINNSN